MQVDPLEGEQRKEENRLVSRDRPCEPAMTVRVRRRERKYSITDVGIMVFLVRIRVMPVVLVDPPPDAQPCQQIAGDQPCGCVAAAGRADLLMPAIVTEERNLGGGQAQQGCGNQSPPRRADSDEQPPTG